MSYTEILVGEPRPMVRRITLNRPEKRTRDREFGDHRTSDGQEG